MANPRGINQYTRIRSANVGYKKAIAQTRQYAAEKVWYNQGSRQEQRMIDAAISRAGGSFSAARKMVAREIRAVRKGSSRGDDDLGYLAASLTKVRNSVRRR